MILITMCTVLVRAIGLFITQHQIPVQPNSNFQLLYDGLGWCREEMLYTSGTIQETSIVGRRVGPPWHNFRCLCQPQGLLSSRADVNSL